MKGQYHLNNVVCHDDELTFGEIPEDAFERLNAMAAKAPAGSGNALFLPWLNGAIAPAENSYARGGFFNLSLDATRAHMGRAVVVYESARLGCCLWTLIFGFLCSSLPARSQPAC